MLFVRFLFLACEQLFNVRKVFAFVHFFLVGCRNRCNTYKM